ncbi:glycosyltransferase 87 family protein [Nocardia cyriacigeorgica]|uniref:Polyprenol-phosphate-mannose-dependent alpha-(1-2)-phosphatidylinositol mannoside mannosyltransferase n=1 Tax=Nocardia cyriacigeorgica TaxID=135487 RepID=A0A4U8WGL9_9NOCA|nr:glycosyltransferase 87 family protein [Nocardia cyriacigeorgica]VFB01099.1 Polyprenol-phosphate-mannose-dependent alpha-(1-2)-phosphatidylinositol mannoside mannosyltransferase [Nocardia cyriacigeorgica]
MRWLTGAIALFVIYAIIAPIVHWWDGYIDLQVYRNGARVWLDDGDLYGPMPEVFGIGLPFTYPPLAALFFAPLALMPLGLAEIVVLATSVLSLGITLWLVLSRIRPELDRMTVLAAVIAAVAVAGFFEPVRQTYSFGQINLVLMAAVALDCLVRKPFWPRGMLIGIAVSVKLIPAGYLLYFLLRKDWKAAGTLIASAIGAVGLGFLVFPSDSVEYWFHTLADTGRIGPPYYAGNQSLKGLAFRLGVSDSVATVIWISLSLVAIGLAALWMRRLIEVGASVAALMVNAAAILLVSPVSWSHHWVWVAPALLVTADAIARGRRNPLLIGAVTAMTVMFLIGPHWLLPHEADRELDWSWWQQILGSGYVITTFAVFVVAVLTYRPTVSGVKKAASAAA